MPKRGLVAGKLYVLFQFMTVLAVEAFASQMDHNAVTSPLLCVSLKANVSRTLA
jgi:hypothetical protein